MPDPMFILRGFLGLGERESVGDGLIAQIRESKGERFAFVATDPRHSLELAGHDPARFGFKPLRATCKRTGETLIAGIPVGSKE